MNDTVAAEFARLDTLLRHDLNRDLDHNRKDIIEILDNEIAERYFSDSDLVKRSLEGDAALDTARSVLSSPDRYKAILRPKK